MTTDSIHLPTLPLESSIDWERFCAALRLCPELARVWTEHKRLEALTLSQAGGHSAAGNDADRFVLTALNTASLGK